MTQKRTEVPIKRVVKVLEEYKEDFDVLKFVEVANYSQDCCTRTICAQCGYRFHKSDDIVRVKQTGDAVHRNCFADYAEDSVSELCDILYL